MRNITKIILLKYGRFLTFVFGTACFLNKHTSGNGVVKSRLDHMLNDVFIFCCANKG